MVTQTYTKTPVVQVCAPNNGPPVGNAVYVGYGRFLTAHHVIETARTWPSPHQTGLITLRVPGPVAWDGPVEVGNKYIQSLRPRELGILSLGAPEDNEKRSDLGRPLWPRTPVPILEAKITCRDNWERLTVRGWLWGRGSSTQWEFTGYVSGSVVQPQVTEPVWELTLEQSAGKPLPEHTLAGLSGSGVFNPNGQLVGVVSQERSDTPGRSLYFVSLDDWPNFWVHSEEAPAVFEARSLEPWSDIDLTMHPRPFSRDSILMAVEDTLKQYSADPKGSGYIVLLGGPQRGKSAIMAELIRRAGPTGVPWLFIVRNQVTQAAAENVLLKQIAYLLGFSKNDVLPKAEAIPGKALGKLLTEGKSKFPRKEPLVLYIDALDELGGSQKENLLTASLAFLPQPLPERVYAVVSLRHEPERRAQVTRTRPCLGIIDLDPNFQPEELRSLRRLATPEAVRESNALAITEFWEDWQSRDGHGTVREDLRPAIKTIPDDLMAAIQTRGGNVVGYHVAYSRYLERFLRLGSWPRTQDVPEDLDDINKIIWESIKATRRTERGDRHAFGLIAAARSPLRPATLARLVSWPDEDGVNGFLKRAFAALHVPDDKDGEIKTHHITWNDYVRRELFRDDLTECHEKLACGAHDYPMEDLDKTYWLRHSPAHLMAIITAPTDDVKPAQRKRAKAEWVKRLSDPMFLAERGVLDGVDALLAVLGEGIPFEGELPGAWRHALTSLQRQAAHLRASAALFAEDARGDASTRF